MLSLKDKVKHSEYFTSSLKYMEVSKSKKLHSIEIKYFIMHFVILQQFFEMKYGKIDKTLIAILKEGLEFNSLNNIQYAVKVQECYELIPDSFKDEVNLFLDNSNYSNVKKLN